MAISDDDLRRILGYCEQATPGPWRAVCRSGGLPTRNWWVDASDETVAYSDQEFDGAMKREDAAMIGKARMHLPAVAAALLELREECRKAANNLDRWADEPWGIGYPHTNHPRKVAARLRRAAGGE